MTHDEASEIKKVVDAAHRRLDELWVDFSVLKGRFESVETAIGLLRTVPESLAEIRAELRAVIQRLPQQAAPISPWSVLITVLGWVVSLILAVVAWMLK